MKKQDNAHRWFHAGAWLGLVATAYTNYQAAPVPELQVGYLAVPVLSAVLSEGLIRKWSVLPRPARALLSAMLFACVAVSYEHFVHMILSADGTFFAAWVGGAVIDATIFACVLATAAFRSVPGVPERAVLVVPAEQPEQNTGTEQDALPERTGTPEQDSVPAVPEHLALTGTPEQNRDSEPEQTGTPERAAVPMTASSERTRTSTRRKQNTTDDVALRVIATLDAPGTREVMRALDCGGSRAERLLKLYEENGVPQS